MPTYNRIMSAPKGRGFRCVCAPADPHTEPKSKRWLQDLFIDDYFDDLTVIEDVKEHGLAWEQTESLHSMWPNS
jgi:hypothetical protein